VPVFVLGVLAVLAVWVARPLWHSAASGNLKRDYLAVRAALDDPQWDGQGALALAQDLLERIDQCPERQGEIHFLLGSVYVRLAGQAAPEQAADLWRQAVAHLEQSASLNFLPTDGDHLLYRLGQAWYATGADPYRVATALSRSVENGADDRAEGYGLLSQAYMRLPVPDVAAALEANQKQLALATGDDDQLAPIRLFRADLLLRRHQGDEARQVLRRIGPGAPGDVSARARLLLAQSCQQDKLWAEAAPLWEQMLRAPGTPPSESFRFWYYLGVCYRHLKRPGDAIAAWEKASSAGGEIQQAAAFGLAEVHLSGANPASALRWYEGALHGITSLANYHNSLVDLEEARQLLEQGCRFYSRSGDHERAHHLAVLSGTIGLPGPSQELLAETADAWAEDCRRNNLPAEVDLHFQRAGAAYEALAATPQGRPEPAKWLWRSADRYRQGHSLDQASALLRRFLALETAPERLGEGWFVLAEVTRELGQESPARDAYRKCIEYPGRFAYGARFRLAQADVEHQRWDDAQETLEQNLKLMRSSPDDEFYQQSLFALADLLVRRGSYRLATIRLQEALERYPGHARGLPARLQLADCYRRLAAQEDQSLSKGHYLTEDAQLHFREQRRLWLQMAVVHYRKLLDDLMAPPKVSHLTADEEAMRRQAELAIADCHFELCHYGEALIYYEQAVPRHSPVERLAILKQITRCCWLQRERAKATATIRQMRDLLLDLPVPAFRGQPDGLTRLDWEQWLDWAERQ
jgi:tetratricopeptide (TPR) repeat protein